MSKMMSADYAPINWNFAGLLTSTIKARVIAFTTWCIITGAINYLGVDSLGYFDTP